MQNLQYQVLHLHMEGGYQYLQLLQCAVSPFNSYRMGTLWTKMHRISLGPKATKPFMAAYSLVAVVGATMNLGLMWSIAETFNGLMVIPNLIAVFLLSNTVVQLLKIILMEKVRR